MESLKVAFLTQDFQGPQTFSINYYIAVLLHFLDHRYKVEKAVIFSKPYGNYASRSVKEAMIDYDVGAYPARVAAVTLDVADLNDPQVFGEFDLVLCTMYWWGDVLETLVRYGRGRPAVVYWLPSLLMQEYLALRQRRWKQIDLMVELQKKCVAAADYVIFNSRADRERGYAYYGSEILAKSSVIYPVSMPPPVRWEKSCDGEVRFGYAGRWDVRKGVHLLVEAFFRFYCRQGASLSITSDFLDHGYDAGDLLDQSAARKLETLRAAGAVEFSGWKSCRIEYLREMRRCDVLLVPSLYDPFNIVAYDAIVMGIPTVVSRFCGVEEIVHNANPRVVKINPWDLDEFDAAMKQMVEATKLRQEGDARAILTYDVDRMIDDTFALFQSLLNTARSGRRGAMPEEVPAPI